MNESEFTMLNLYQHGTQRIGANTIVYSMEVWLLG